MTDQEVARELQRLLTPHIGEHGQKKDAVYEEDVTGVIDDAIAFQVGEKFLARVKAQPNTPFWELFRQMALEDIPAGMLTPPGQEYILEDDGE